MRLAIGHWVKMAINGSTKTLAALRPGMSGLVVGIDDQAGDGLLGERLREMGFVEDAFVELLHEGPFGADPLAVKVERMIVALRRAEAEAVRLAVEAP